MKRERRRARSLALQVLYEVDCVGHPVAEVIARNLSDNSSLGDEAARFFQNLVLGTLGAKSILDDLIADCAPEWPIDELAIVDRSVLRLALWELLAFEQTPLKVVINEAVELAKRYGSSSAPRFVNGVLGTIALQKQEIRRRTPQITEEPS
ncbi:MAG: transcription antitermination factor NusB [Chloroflexi bacterium RBG_16_48_8]|nr:MAG: transcription antitermination factor NusB [Chloroflexi bacterium RBG_16_48_8]